MCTVDCRWTNTGPAGEGSPHSLRMVSCNRRGAHTVMCANRTGATCLLCRHCSGGADVGCNRVGIVAATSWYSRSIAGIAMKWTAFFPPSFWVWRTNDCLLCTVLSLLCYCIDGHYIAAAVVVVVIVTIAVVVFLPRYLVLLSVL